MMKFEIGDVVTRETKQEFRKAMIPFNRWWTWWKKKYDKLK